MAEDPLQEFLRTLRRNVGLVVALTTLACGGFAAYRVYSQPPQFRAGASVRITNIPQEMTAGIGGQDPGAPMAISVDPVLSQIQVLKSRAVAQLAVRTDLLRLRPLSRALPFTLLDSVVVAPDAPSDTLSFAFGETDYTVSDRRTSVTRPYGALPAGRRAVQRPSAPPAKGDVASLARGLASRLRGTAPQDKIGRSLSCGVTPRSTGSPGGCRHANASTPTSSICSSRLTTRTLRSRPRTGSRGPFRRPTPKPRSSSPAAGACSSTHSCRRRTQCWPPRRRR